MSIDAATTLAICAATAATVGALILFAWAQDRRNRYLALWGAGDLVGGAGGGLLLLHGWAPPLLSVAAADALLILAYALIWAAARDVGGRRTAPSQIVCGALLWLAACAVPQFFASLVFRVILASGLLAAYSAAAGLELWSGRRERLPSRLPAAAWLLLHAFMCVSRIPLALTARGHAVSVMQSRWFAILVFETLIEVIAMGILIISIAKERAELEQRVAASTDELTGAASRRAFLGLGELRLRDALRGGVETSLLLFDLDHFKTVNDSFGHEAGDRVLRAFAKCATRTLRPNDLFGRLGGEEFAALLVGADASAALAVAERVRRAVEGIDVKAHSQPLRVSVSAGVSTTSDRRRSLGEMLRDADHALYRAKSAGRNRIEQADMAPKLVA